MTVMTKQEIEALAARLEGPTMTAAKDLIAAYFGDKSKCLASIPADPSRDADLLVTADIKAAATLARTALDALARLEDAEAAQALVVERAVEAAYEADSLEIFLHGANGIAERIRAFAQASGVKALAALRARERESVMQALASMGQAQDAYEAQLKAEAERDDALARLAAAEGRVAALTPLLEQVGARLGAARQTGTLNTGWHDLEAAIRAALASAEAATTRNTINKETKE